MNSPIMTGAFDKRLWDRFKTKSAKYSWLRHYETSSDIRSQGWTSAVERLRPGRKRSPSGAFGGWNDLDRMVKWREGGDETNPIALCLVRRALLRCGGGSDELRGKNTAFGYEPNSAGRIRASLVPKLPMGKEKNYGTVADSNNRSKKMVPILPSSPKRVGDF